MENTKENIKIRPQQIDDAERFCKILNNENFKYFDVRPTLKEEIEFIKQNEKNIKNNFQHNFTILYNNKIIGSVGVKIDQHRTHIGELGYFIDENYWGKGLAIKAVKLLENYCFNKLNLKRLIIVMAIENKASEKIAIKCNYKKEGTMKQCFKIFNKYHDAYLYAKIPK